MNNYFGYFDGSCGPVNPGGTAGYGFVLTKNGSEVDRGSGVIGSGPGMTNNLAEHYALKQVLLAFLQHYGEDVSNTILNLRGDSKLVVNQMNRLWKVSPDKPYYPEAIAAFELLSEIRRKNVVVYIEWVPREKNTICDELSKNYSKAC